MNNSGSFFTGKFSLKRAGGSQLAHSPHNASSHPSAMRVACVGSLEGLGRDGGGVGEGVGILAMYSVYGMYGRVLN